MRVFVTGATGYIGGTIAVRLQAAGHSVSGLVRDPEKAAALRAGGIEPVIGSLDDSAILTSAAGESDGVINAASSDHEGAVAALLDALAGSGKPLIHTSGTSVVADTAAGEPSARVFDERSAFTPVPERRARAALDRKILAAASRGLRPIVLCNSLIYGRGRGLHADSVQVPLLIAWAKARGVPTHIGRGLNVWSTVHVDDVADLYAMALERAPAGNLYYVENGEASFRDMAATIGRVLGMPPPERWPIEEAIAELGRAKALFTMSSNSRVRGWRARAELGWTPRHGSVLAWIEEELRNPRTA